jgi:hypothetical protein
MSLDDGRPSSGLCHVPGNEFAPSPAAEDEYIEVLRLRHGVLLFFVIAGAA